MIITITRYRLTNPGRMQCWAYSYTVEGSPMTCQYGPNLASLRARLRKKYPNAVVVEAWAVVVEAWLA